MFSDFCLKLYYIVIADFSYRLVSLHIFVCIFIRSEGPNSGFLSLDWYSSRLDKEIANIKC